MAYYAVQVLSGAEQDFVRRCAGIEGVSAFIPRRTLLERRKGKVRSRTRPVFPGYAFLSCDELDPRARWSIRRIEGFCRFLKSNEQILPMSERDVALLSRFMSIGRNADISTVSFDENDKVKVIAGPLVGQEALIVKVDRRKRRLRVILTLYDRSFPIDLSYVCVEKLTGCKGARDEGKA